MLEHNPNLDRLGNAMEFINGVAAGAVNPFLSAGEAVGVGDALYGTGYAIDKATMYGIAPLSADGKWSAIEKLDRLAGVEKDIVNAVRDWSAENPNAAETVEAALNVAAVTKAAKLAKTGAGKAAVSEDFADAYSTRKVAEEAEALRRIAKNQKSTPNLNNKGSGSVAKEQTNRRISDILSNADKGRNTKGKAVQYEKYGGYNAAKADFDSLNPQNVQQRIKGTITGTLPDGRNVNVRAHSSGNVPTLEIHYGKNQKIKVRYK